MKALKYTSNKDVQLSGKSFMLVERETGCIIDATLEEKQLKPSEKFFKEDSDMLCDIIEQLRGKEPVVFAYLYRRFNGSMNCVSTSYTKIKDDTGLSESTVCSAMAKLKKLNFMKYKGDGFWMLNPLIRYYGLESHKWQLYAIYMNIKET